MGSSLGGLISFYGAMKRPDIFRKAGIFSPSYQVNDSVWLFVRNTERMHPMRLYQLVGDTENDFMIDKLEQMHGVLGEFGYSEEIIKYKIVEGGVHHCFLGTEFREVYLWLFPEATSSARKSAAFINLAVYPNPVLDNLFIEIPLPDEDISIRIYNMTGSLVKSENKRAVNQFDVGDLPGGLYVLRISGRTINYAGKFVRE